nr:MAG TPA: hypothetical protein [Caudoviricetes sp.]
MFSNFLCFAAHFLCKNFPFHPREKFRLQVLRQFLHLLDERFNNKLFIKNRHIFLSSRVFFIVHRNTIC